MMHCAIAAVSSPSIFGSSPRKLSPIFCKGSAVSPPPPSPLSSPSGFAISNILSGEGEGPGTSNQALLKRKRPTRIIIPVTRLGYEDAESRSVTDGIEMELNGEGYSVCCKRGRRGGVMEDRYSAVLDIQGDPKQAFFGVFDGHGGSRAAEFAAKNLDKNIMNEVSNNRGGKIEEAVKEGYLSTDSEFLKEDCQSGTCCVSVFIHKGDVVVSNAGDCRAVLSRGGVAEALTVDHRPSREDERDRIQNLGGYVDYSTRSGVWRVHGTLAVSRAIGDRHLKQFVIAEPDTKVIRIRPECEFLILASDGLWDNVSNQEAVDLVRSFCIGVDKPEAFSACKKLVDLSNSRGSLDDITVMVIQLARFIH